VQHAQRSEAERATYNAGAVFNASVALHVRFAHVFNCPNAARAEAYRRQQLECSVPRREVLEIGCFDGFRLRDYARLSPKQLIGVDISDVLVARARADGLDARVMDAHHLQFPDASFDCVLGTAILHHLEYDKAVHEVHRVLRPGGTAIFTEPLRDNPAWKLFRALTPNARTRDELPLSRDQIESADRLFGEGRHCFSGFASTFIGSMTSFLPLSPDNGPLRLADRFDRRVERTALRYWMSHVVLVWRKSPATLSA
jgi:SAM-dependent methyltransferase